MGMNQTVTFAERAVPPWTAVSDLLARRGFPVQVRMIDGELAFPDEAPPASWRELRVGTPHGMVTLRREKQGIVFVTWGNADAPMRQAWNALAWACAEAGGGQSLSSSGPQSAAEFFQTAELPAVLKG
jgi:hypothetical protein